MEQQPKILCVIPSRLNSTRLPRKPLVLIGNKPMIQWVYEAACQCVAFSKVIVATDSEEIEEVIKKLGGHVEMTPSELPTGTDRVACIAKKYPEYDVVVNLQGDEPFIKPEMLVSLVSPYLNGINPAMATLACPLNLEKEYNDPNTVKVIYNKLNHAIYFSRSPIPYFRQQNIENVPILMHLGLYAFTRKFLLEYTQMEQTPLEKSELLEQLRAVENGVSIYVSQTPHRIIEINYPEDLENARKYVEELK
ncbi:MAG: 3-deoxy-manno-octulosonate cytidylyltransferase [Bdellovibrionota bacterium]